MTNKRSCIKKDHPFYKEALLFRMNKNHSYTCSCNGKIISSLRSFNRHINEFHR